MPELPEVETIIRGLTPLLVGQTVTALEVSLPKTLWLDDVRATGQVEVQQAKQLLEGASIKTLRRRGKMMIIELNNESVILIHLKMTGQLIYLDAQQRRTGGGHPTSDMIGALPAKSTHAIFHLSGGGTLYFNDQRQFGYIKILPASSLAQHAAYAKFGPEPLEEGLTIEYLWAKAQRRPKLAIKTFILDQSIIAGIGNIYADESLFVSKIYPGKMVKDVTKAEMSNLIANIRQVLQLGLQYGGTSSEHYVQADGSKGTMQEHLQVYRKQGQSCPVCGHMIERIVIGGRGTHFCPHCQI